MNAHDLLERRAQRGLPRGATRVWADAQLAGAADRADPKHRSTMLLRFAILVSVLGLVALGIARQNSTETNNAVSDSTIEDDPQPIQSDEPLPAPLLVDGGTLRRHPQGVMRPVDPGFDADDIFGGIFEDTEPPEVLDGPRDRSTTVVFASPSNPFEGPIVGLELLEGGGFRPWGANSSDAELADSVQQLERVDGVWSMPADTGLVEVARFQDDNFNFLRFGWQFDFELAGDGDGEVTIQAETTDADTALSEWIWIARLAGQGQGEGQANVTVEPIDVLGVSGLVIDTHLHGSDDGVIWFSEGFVYRMTASRLQDNTSFGRDSTEEIARLRIVDRSEWVDAISDSLRTSPQEWIVGGLGILVRLALLISTILFLAKRSFQAAALAAATLAAWFALTGSTTSFGSVALTALGLGLAWWLHRRPSSPTAQLPRV